MTYSTTLVFGPGPIWDRVEAYPTLACAAFGRFSTPQAPHIDLRLVVDPDLAANLVLHENPIRCFNNLLVTWLADSGNSLRYHVSRDSDRAVPIKNSVLYCSFDIRDSAPPQKWTRSASD